MEELPTRRPAVDTAFAKARELHECGQFAEAEHIYRSILTAEPGHFDAAHLLGLIYLQRGEYADAERQIGRAIEINPHIEGAYNNRGNALKRLERLDEALVSYDKAIALKPDFAEAFNNRANALQVLNRPDSALASYDKAIALKPDHLETISNRASVLSDRKRFPEALADCEKAFAIDPGHARTTRVAVGCLLQACDWRALESQKKNIAAALAVGSSVVTPFDHRALSGSEEEHLLSARLWVADECPPAATPLWRGERYRHDKIRLAYLSSDFREHAVAHLIAGVFERHDKDRFETIAISFGRDDKSEPRARIVFAFDHFIDVQDRSDAAVAALMREMEIDIAVDLNGHTKDSRPGILAFRPAPLQANFLGYPGTIGADYLDYIIADRFVIPEAHRTYYSEKVVYLPDTYQANTKRRVADKIYTRAEAGLPESGFVFCSFNNTYKIMPEIFEIWMRLLHRVEHSVLWLLEDNSYAVSNLRREAEARGIPSEKLIFAPRKKPADHLARQRLADLFLDTLPYNAHTTASDALWMDLPVLTCPGHTFPGRVAASLLNAIGLPELVTDSLSAYEALALALARDPARLAAIKVKLATHRDTFPLFDTGRFTRNLEAAFVEMWRRHQNGGPPESFTVPEPVGRIPP
jgi:predicted O-linked N-acetylglucosamine transferase (SPINDLY family)